MGIINTRSAPPPPQPVSPPVVIAPPEPAKPAPTDAEIAAEARTESLLRRSRGRFGTILTGFRGFLDESNRDETTSRKTLLGE